MAHVFTQFYSNEKAYSFLYRNCLLALQEDGVDVTANAIFTPEAKGKARIVAKSPMVVAGIDYIPTILRALQELGYEEAGDCRLEIMHHDSSQVCKNTEREELAHISGSLRVLFKAERVLLNYIIHLSGIATLTNKYVEALEGTGITVLDTRKTAPALRYPQKYAVLAGGGKNHRMDLEEMILIRDVFTDYAGSVTEAITHVREYYGETCPPIALECRTIAEVHEAIECNPNRIMLDNMEASILIEALQSIPKSIETEITGGITLENIHTITSLPIYPQYISVGSITHSAPSVDCSMYIML